MNAYPGHLWFASAAMLSLAACSPAAPPTAPAGSATVAAIPTVFETMTQSFTPHSNRMWELSGSLYADNGELDAKQLSDQQWQELAGAATALREVADTLAGSTAPRVAPDGVKLQSEGTPEALGAAQVQTLIDADLQGFKDEARKASTLASEVIAAAQVHDAVRADDAANRMNEACASCHNRFWYPNQAAQASAQ